MSNKGKNNKIKDEILEIYEETNKKLEENIDKALRTGSLGLAGKFHLFMKLPGP